MSMNRPDIEPNQRAAATSLHEHWVLFLVEGIILVILGLAAIAIPSIATLAVEILVGWLFLISGIAGWITTFWMGRVPGFWWSLVSAMLGIAAGIMLLLRPLSGVLSLTLVLIVFFVIEGVASMMFALEHKRELSGRWGWMLASGIIDLILAAYHFCRPARHRGLGYRAGGRNQYGIRRPGADRDGTACPRDRSAFDCLGALSGGRLAPRLTAMGQTRHLIGVLATDASGVRESAQSWRELLVDIKQRGLEIAPDLAVGVGDGALGFWKAIEQVFPSTRHQRCWVRSDGAPSSQLESSQKARSCSGAKA